MLGNKDEVLFVDDVAANEASNLRLKRRSQFVICSQGDHDKSFGYNFFSNSGKTLQHLLVEKNCWRDV